VTLTIIKLQIDVDPLIENLVERSQQQDFVHNDNIKSQLEDALTKKQETEAKLHQSEARLAQLEEVLRLSKSIKISINKK